jgi:hypothetical protein
MGILKHLLFWPVTGPSFLTRFSLEKVSDTVREELTTDDPIKEELLALQMRLELGDLDDDQYVAEEAKLMQRLRDVRYWREEFGMSISGGPVRVGAAESTPDSPATPDEPTAGDAHASTEDRERRDGFASPEGAQVEVRLDWE